MWACLNKNCPCLPFRNSQPPFDHYSYDDEDNREFESLLAEQNPESIAAFLSRTPFQRPGAGGSEYVRIDNMVPPNEETLASTNNLLDDEDNLQTQDAVFLPDEQISKFTELVVNEQTKYDQATDAQLAAEEEEARRLEEEEIERKRRAATEVALAKGTAYSVNLDESSVELSTTESQRNTSIYEEEHNSSLNKPRNPHERFVTSEVNEDDYETDFDDLPPTNSKDQATIDDPLTRSVATTQQGA
ncbi:10413_t:CDS:2 [Funneliformis caledonium]|uniref:10413_t:CDS:1 n=2 Tax=Funneliformis TaxID=1117308 RepID=A0A9N8YN62_9GLOM|nr:7524_t:CDS:2 [Funneliformis mosseae]CAG8440681.1 10413_t:CDS:2 [Funneliformis caledonium]